MEIFLEWYLDEWIDGNMENRNKAAETFGAERVKQTWPMARVKCYGFAHADWLWLQLYRHFRVNALIVHPVRRVV
jgi:hypothetical protein